ncbi:MAG: DNA cytosine methyltransferase [Oscillospiraceae bacterium]|nr:DNA cytosine methyltransferase [Oscillospiraceae bacterium]
MIQIATVFSGIGAAEQALQQLGVEHRIVFACDNGERYLQPTFKEITNILEHFLPEYRESILRMLYDSTGKPNNVKKSYFANYDIDESRWFEDIRFIDGKPYKGQVDLFVGGSPCQSFSTYGHKRGLEDVRGTLFYDYARLVQEIQPKAFIFENVTGMLTHDHKRTWQVIKDTFEMLNYDIKYEVLNAKDYNLPQLRKRLFVVGINRKLKCPEYEFPKAVPLTHKSTEYLEDNIPNEYYLPEKGFNFVTKVERSQRRARVNQDIIGCQTANQQFNWVGDFRVETPQQRHIDDPRIFVGEYEGKPAVARKMIPRELLRLMGFSDNFKIVVDDNVMWRQTGNSIAVPVIKAVIEQIIKTLDL